ncbi:hypothetical protein AGLY_001888 [Aphis glycines]|uniref:Chromo shadow domain-containing protein n=1 Tax=Aphis glycines TaxID=307491 RepID=A0A6G0U558_APHGL|nr:hypothetical protein AGLY_001888 [Aphis glycines]
MSVDLNTVVPVNGLDDYIAQSPKDDAAATALPEQPSLNGVAHSSSQSMEVVVSSENDDDVSAAAADVPSPLDDVSAAAADVPSPIDDVSAAAADVPSPIDDVSAAADDVPYPIDDVSAAAADTSSPMDETFEWPLDDEDEDNLVEDKNSDIRDNVNKPLHIVYRPCVDPYDYQRPPPQQLDPVDVVPDLNVAGPSRSSDDVPKNEMKLEVVDLGIDSHFYEDNNKKVGYDRGLEADYIVGATQKDGKLMFLIAWKNSIDGEADLLEAKEVYKRSPQIAIKYFEERLCYVYPSKKT